MLGPSRLRPRFLLALGLVLLLGGLVSHDLAGRHQADLIARLDSDSTGVANLLADRLNQSLDSFPLVKLGYRLAAADQCNLALPVLDRAQALNSTYRDVALLTGWCQLNLAQKATTPAAQATRLAQAKTQITQGRALDPLDPFGQSLELTLQQLEMPSP